MANPLEKLQLEIALAKVGPPRTVKRWARWSEEHDGPGEATIRRAVRNYEIRAQRPGEKWEWVWPRDFFSWWEGRHLNDLSTLERTPTISTRTPAHVAVDRHLARERGRETRQTQKAPGSLSDRALPTQTGDKNERSRF